MVLSARTQAAKPVTGKEDGPPDEAAATPERSGAGASEALTSSRKRHTVSVRPMRLAVGTGFLLLLALAGWLGVSGYRAYTELTAAKHHVQQLKAALEHADTATAQRELDLAASNAAAAHKNTDTVPWNAMAAVPIVGEPFAAGAQISSAVNDLTDQVLRPAVAAGAALSPDVLLARDGVVNLDAILATRAPLEQATMAAKAVSAAVTAIPGGGYVPALDTARTELQQQTAELLRLLQAAGDVATQLPPMLGNDGPRNYFIGFQTNAEARGTGGLLGSFAILRAEHGRLTLVTTGSGSNADLIDQRTNTLDFGTEFAQQGYIGNATTVWGNSNISANFPYVAQIWSSLWQMQSGQQVDGVIATDPVALSYVLDATGGLTMPDGVKVGGADFVRLTESEMYRRFPSLDVADRNARKDYEQKVSEEIVQKIITGAGDHAADLLRAFGKAAGEGRLAVWSALASEQAVLATTPLAHQVPDDSAPYAGVVVNNSSHGKLDYYLGRKLTYTAGACTGPTRHSAVTVTLTNNAPTSGLPPFVTIGSPPGAEGTNRSDVSLYATVGAHLTGVTVDGLPANIKAGTERNHPVFTVDVSMAPGATVVVKYTLDEPTAPGPARVPIQPLVLPMHVTVEVPNCATGR